MTELRRIIRYPIKGFGGQNLPAVEVRPGGGLPYDRKLAIANGSRPVPTGGQWTVEQAFVRLAENPDLPQFGTEMTGSSVRLESPAGQHVRMCLDEPTDLAAVNTELAGWFPAGQVGPPHLVIAGDGLWDHQDATVSLINLDTVADLTQAAGRPVDPLRFRGNLYLSGMPAWSEFGLLGRRIRLGEVELEVLRPIDRCVATSVNPDTATRDLNIPGLLGEHYGHVYCGVYARVVTGGQLTTGQHLNDIGPAPQAAHDGTRVHTAPQPARWPRFAQATSTGDHYWLRDPLAGIRPPATIGQHLRLHTGPAWSTRPISAVDGDHLQVPAQPGPPQTELLITGPFG